MTHATIVLLVPCLFSCGKFKKTDKNVKMRDVQEFYTYKHLSDAPEKIKGSSQAVVKIEIGGASGTGFFISGDGLIMTNNHVVGVDNCARTGCYGQVITSFQKGSYSSKNKYFFEPRYVDPNLDVSVYQLKDSKGGAKVSSTKHLKIREESSRDLIEQKVYFIGHPRGGLKKWTETTVYRAEGDFFYSNNLVIGGSSGSPYINEDGEVIGILHSGSASGHVSRHGFKAYSKGTASSAFIEKASSILEGQLNLAESSLNLLEDIKDHGVITAQNIDRLSTLYQTSEEEEPKGQDGHSLFLREYAAYCEQALEVGDNENPRDSIGIAYYYCGQGPLAWLNSLLPNQVKSKWIEMAESYADLANTSHMAVASLSYRSLYKVASKVRSDYEGKKIALAKIDEQKPALDFRLAEILTFLGQEFYEGVYLADFVRQYHSKTNFEEDYINIILSQIHLKDAVPNQTKVITVREALNSPNISLDDYLSVEVLAYQSRLL